MSDTTNKTPDEEDVVLRANVQLSTPFEIELRVLNDGEDERAEIVVRDLDGGSKDECAFFDADEFFEAIDRLRAFLTPREPTPAERTREAITSLLPLAFQLMGGTVIDRPKKTTDDDPEKH